MFGGVRAAILIAISSFMCSVWSSVNACAVPLEPYRPESATAAIVGTVSRVHGQNYEATYRIKTESIVRDHPQLSPLPRYLTIKVMKFVLGTCGLGSPLLKPGDRITLYFGTDRGIIFPVAWTKFPAGK